MNFLKLGIFSFIFCLTVLPVAQAQTKGPISETAKKISDLNDKKAELEKDNVKTGQQIKDIGSLTIDDFLELDAVPDGMDAVSASVMNTKDEAFNFMTQNQALASLKLMRDQGIQLPKDLEDNIRKNPDQMSKLMSEAFEKIPSPNLKTKEDIDNYRRSVIRSAEERTGIEFKEILKNQKKMMTPKE